MLGFAQIEFLKLFTEIVRIYIKFHVFKVNYSVYLPFGLVLLLSDIIYDAKVPVSRKLSKIEENLSIKFFVRYIFVPKHDA